MAIEQFDKTIVLDLHGVCNQQCAYCVAGSSPAHAFGAVKEPSKVQNLLSFLAPTDPSNILCTGGEPLITPGFENLCRAFISQGHTISLQTNLKKSPNSFMAMVRPEKTNWILASLHSVALDHFENFLTHARLLKKYGYPIVVKLILDRRILQNLTTLCDILTDSEIGVILSPLVEFPKGEDPHPTNYTPENWKSIGPHMTLLSSWLYFDGGFRSRNVQCTAGDRLLYISVANGNIRGCSHGYPAKLGNIYDGTFTPTVSPIKCGISCCICDFHYYLGVIDTVDDRNAFARLLKNNGSMVSFEQYRQWLTSNGISPIGVLDGVNNALNPSTSSKEHHFTSVAPPPENLLNPNARSFQFFRCSVPESHSATPSTTTRNGIPIVYIRDLHKHLGFGSEIIYPVSSLQKNLSDWKMQVDDAPIFRYIYRNFRPRRHLEFGTWIGEGVLYCLEESDATVWTINTPFGEDGAGYSFGPEDIADAHAWADKIGLPRTANYTSDSIGFIGMHYLEGNLGHRVCQIYSDSTMWDISNYPPGFFDSVLIDGGHSKQVVRSDTHKAMALTHSDAIIMWHDFCPEVYPKMSSTIGVIEAISEQWEWLQTQCRELFWIYPSWILLGVKK